jgi:hypothetical protein
MAPPVFISAEQFLVTANLGTAPAPGHAAGDDYLDLGTWTTFSGGEMDSSTQSVHPGGMNPPVVTGGRATTGDITITRPFQVGDHNLIFQLSTRVGRASITVTKQPLDADGNVAGLTALVFSGMLKGLTHPEHDAESTDRANWSVVITPNGTFGRVTH